MTKLFLLLVSISLLACSEHEEGKTVILAQHQLKDGSSLLFEIKTGTYLGATTPDVTWINKVEKDGRKLQVGKIKSWLDKGTFSFSPVNDSMFTVRYVDSVWHDTANYTFNINQRIYPNDGSPHIERQRIQNR